MKTRFQVDSSIPGARQMSLQTAALQEGEEPAALQGEKSLRTRAADVLIRLRSDISECRLLPGQRLHLDELSKKYGAGYSPIREALSRLAADGLVILAEYKGYRVAPISREDWLDILVMRRELESRGLSMSMRNKQEGWLDSIKCCLSDLDEQEPPLRDNVMNPEWERCHHAFHRSLIAGCNSPWLLRFSDTLVEQSNRYLRLSLAGRFVTENRSHVSEHIAIVAAIEEGDEGLATALLHNHLARTSKMLLTASPQLFIETTLPGG